MEIAPTKIWIWAPLLAAAAAWAFWHGFRQWRENRLIADTPTSRLRSAAQGYVELCGRGMQGPGQDVRAPLTGLPCIWWRYEIQDRSNGGNRTCITAGETSETPFLLDDGTGKCIVDPRGADVQPAVKDVWYGDTEWPEVRIPDGTGMLGRIADTMLTGRYRYVEQRLEVSAPLYAMGEFRSLGGAGGTATEDAAAQLLHDWKEDQPALLSRFDSNHDGRISGTEWDAARAAAREHVIALRATSPVGPRLHVLGTPADGRVFLISASGGELLARALRRRALASLSLSVAALAALTWLLCRL